MRGWGAAGGRRRHPRKSSQAPMGWHLHGPRSSRPLPATEEPGQGQRPDCPLPGGAPRRHQQSQIAWTGEPAWVGVGEVLPWIRDEVSLQFIHILTDSSVNFVFSVFTNQHKVLCTLLEMQAVLARPPQLRAPRGPNPDLGSSPGSWAISHPSKSQASSTPCIVLPFSQHLPRPCHQRVIFPALSGCAQSRAHEFKRGPLGDQSPHSSFSSRKARAVPWFTSPENSRAASQPPIRSL